MTEVSKKQERASLLSKRILRTNKINSNEAIKLRERLDVYATKYRQRSLRHEEQVLGIKANLNNVVSVKEKMVISPVRRKFLQDHGVTLQMKDVYMEDFITAVDKVLDKGENGAFVDRGYDSDLSNNVSRSRAESAKTEHSGPNSADKFPLHLPLTLLQRKLKGRAASDSSISAGALADEEEEELERVKAPAVRSGTSPRPLSGKQQRFLYRVITPPIKGRHITEAYKEIEEDEKLVKELLERKKFHDRLKKEEGVKKKLPRDNNSSKLDSRGSKEVYGAEKVESTEVGRALSDRHDEDVVALDSEYKEVCISPEVRTKKNVRKVSTTDEDFEKLMQKYLTINREKEASPSLGDVDLVGSPEIYRSSKFDNRNGKDKDRPTEKSVFRLSPSVPRDSLTSVSSGGIQKVNFSEQPLENESESSEEAEPPYFVDSTKWKELVKKVRSELKEREISKQIVTKKARSIKHRTSKISHPTGVDAVEDIIYDARPQKSVAKGYATMHMKVGQRSVSICVPRFKSEGVCKEQTVMRANAKSELKVQKVRVREKLPRHLDSSMT